eukprot:TRINITY_DN41853_c0_g1_i1.p1 TRINITY_DN41853_c0_g1~~TRINITY_DN41853_c0_g1_i1.p1  ORF type:complete len:781 (+),score=137.88 TRINITY_DN41853_c0_g1_i1:70-2412(+)
MSTKGYAAKASSSASVMFVVKCSKTKPGEAVFVVGGHQALGSWSPALSLPMTTTAESYPLWKSAPIQFQSAEAIEYKFLIQREDRQGAAQWQDFQGNHRVSLELGKTAEAKSDWGMAAVQVTIVAQAVPAEAPARSESVEDRVAAQQEKEEMLIKMAETGVEAATAEAASKCPLVVQYANREELRRNFSQSLIDLDLDEDGTKNESSEQRPEVVVASEVREPEDVANEKGQNRGGISLQHVMSFSALCEMADDEEKADHRKGKIYQSQYDPYNLNVPVVVVTSEVAPFSKTGGLGLVAASYAFEFARNGHRTMVVAPKYSHYENLTYVGETRVRVQDQEQCVKYWHLRKNYAEGGGTDYIFVEHPTIQRDGGPYNDKDGREYPDNLLRFTLLSLAAMEAPLILNLNGEGTYGDKVLFLANDWQAGMVPVYLCGKYRKHNCYTSSRCLYVIHNLGYQGQYHNIGDPARFFGIDHKYVGDVSMGNAVNLCKGALICADRVLTVSPNYSKEVQTPEGGFNLQDFVRAKAVSLRLAGILNGIDDCWDPMTDQNLVMNYSVENFEAGKAKNKAALQKQLGLNENPHVCLIGFVGRLTWQKGVDVLASVISWLMQDTGNGVTGRVQLIMMGQGQPEYVGTLRWAENSYRGNICGYVGFDPKVEHLMMGGCDLLLMPSRYEPCGLPQMYSQVYGTLPVVHATGGLVDSVKDIAEGVDTATGFHVFPLSADKLKATLFTAVEMHQKRPAEFRRMQRTAMQADYYWPKAMDEYERQIDIALYECPTVRD